MRPTLDIDDQLLDEARRITSMSGKASLRACAHRLSARAPGGWRDSVVMRRNWKRYLADNLPRMILVDTSVWIGHFRQNPLPTRRCCFSLIGTHSWVVALVMSMSMNAMATLSTGTDEQAQLPYWEISDASMVLRLVQRLPDQTRGFFTARGFSAEHAEVIAQSCVFQTVFKNQSQHGAPSPLEYDLREWIVSMAGAAQGMKTREDWKVQWQRLGVALPAQLAFEWSLYPTQQVYQAGDYNWGMSTFNLKPGTAFDLKLVWRQHGRVHSETIRGMRCAPDVDSTPVAAP